MHHLPDAESWPTLFITACKPQLKWRPATRTESGQSLATFTWPNMNFALAWKICHPWSTLSFDFHPGLSIKIIQRMHFITELGAISRPLSFYLYQRRCFQSEHLDLRRPSMKWNAVRSLLCLLSQKVWSYFYGMHSKERLSQRPTFWFEIWIQILWIEALIHGRLGSLKILLDFYRHYY